MLADRAHPRGSLIARSSPRAAFAELVGGALTEVGLWPSPMATAYLSELPGQRVRSPEPAEQEATRTEALIAARLLRCGQNLPRLVGSEHGQ